MPSIDLIVLASVLLSSLAGGALLWRREIRGRRFALAMITLFYGLVLVITMSAHCLDALGRPYVGQGYDGGGFGYDFRAYSLFLLGILLVGQGVALCRLTFALAAGKVSSRNEAVRRLIVVLCIVAPLIPIQAFFAIPLTALAAMTLGAWLGIGGSAIAGPPSPVHREQSWTSTAMAS